MLRGKKFFLQTLYKHKKIEGLKMRVGAIGNSYYSMNNKTNNTSFKGKTTRGIVVKKQEEQEFEDDEYFLRGLMFPAGFLIRKGKIPIEKTQRPPETILQGDVYYTERYEPVWEWAYDNHIAIFGDGDIIVEPFTTETVDSICYDTPLEALKPKLHSAEKALAYQIKITAASTLRLLEAHSDDEKSKTKEEISRRKEKCESLKYIIERVNVYIDDYMRLL